MRVKIRLKGLDRRVAVPVHYNHLVQAMVYSNLKATMAEELHNKGKVVEGRAFKLFVFSRLFGAYQRNEHCLIFTSEINFYLAIPMTELLSSFAEHLVRKGVIRLAENQMEVLGIEVLMPVEFKGDAKVRFLSPVTVYSTLLTGDGRKRTYYYSPFEKEFTEQIQANLKKKYQAVFGERAKEDWRFELEPDRVDPRNQRILKYKGTVIKAWDGIYHLNADEELFRLAYDTGLGAKNSQGFGMMEVVNQC